MIKVGIVGGTGYTGVELLRILANHPAAQVEVITSRSEEGVKVAAIFPNLREAYPNLAFSVPEVSQLGACDVVFFATPHGVAHGLAAELLAAGTRVIDLSADFRLADVQVWEAWYGQKHGAPELLGEAVYGLPEVNRQAISQARLVAVPGCYPTAVQLGLLPLFEQGLVEAQGTIADCKTGVTGGGRSTNLAFSFCEAGESVKAYGVAKHRHQPEIAQGLSRAAKMPVSLTFVPHLVPMLRGIHATLYTRLTAKGAALSDAQLQEVFEHRYQAEPCVDVMPWNSCPETRSVRGANMCRIGLHRPQEGDQLIVLAAIDNLVKGASGQAIQNMNLMFGQDELAGLKLVGLMP